MIHLMCGNQETGGGLTYLYMQAAPFSPPDLHRVPAQIMIWHYEVFHKVTLNILTMAMD